MNFEEVFLKILKIVARPDFLEIEYDLDGGIYVGFICLDDSEDSDTFDFTWKIGKNIEEQSEKTKQTLAILFYENES